MKGLKARAKKRDPDAPRRGRPPNVETIRMYSTGATGEIARFVMTHDVVERLMQLRDSFQLKLIDTRGLRVQFLRPRELNMPATLMRMEPPTYDPVGQRITRVHTAGGGAISMNRYQVHVRCKHLNLVPDFKPVRLELLWLDAARGILLIFPDDIVDYVEGLISDRDAIIKEAAS